MFDHGFRSGDKIPAGAYNEVAKRTFDTAPDAQSWFDGDLNTLLTPQSVLVAFDDATNSPTGWTNGWGLLDVVLDNSGNAKVQRMLHVQTGDVATRLKYLSAAWTSWIVKT